MGQSSGSLCIHLLQGDGNKAEGADTVDNMTIALFLLCFVCTTSAPASHGSYAYKFEQYAVSRTPGASFLPYFMRIPTVVLLRWVDLRGRWGYSNFHKPKPHRLFCLFVVVIVLAGRLVQDPLESSGHSLSSGCHGSWKGVRPAAGQSEFFIGVHEIEKRAIDGSKCSPAYLCHACWLREKTGSLPIGLVFLLLVTGTPRDRRRRLLRDGQESVSRHTQTNRVRNH